MNQPGTSSGAIAVTAGSQVLLGPGVLLNVEVDAGSAAGSVAVYDGVDTTGVKLAGLEGVAIGTSQVKDIAQGVAFAKGLFVVVTGTASSAILIYRTN